MWKVVSKREVKRGTIWRRMQVFLIPPQHIFRFRVRGLDAVWRPENRPKCLLLMHAYAPRPLMPPYTYQESFEDVENCENSARTLENPRPYWPINDVYFEFWEDVPDVKSAGFMNYAVEIDQIFPHFPVLPVEYYGGTVERYHTC